MNINSNKLFLNIVSIILSKFKIELKIMKTLFDLQTHAQYEYLVTEYQTFTFENYNSNIKYYNKNKMNESVSSFTDYATLSEDEHYEEIKRLKEGEIKLHNALKEWKQSKMFLDYYNDNFKQQGSIFTHPGVVFKKFTYKNIRFSFKPSDVVPFIDEKTVFKIKISHFFKNWRLRRSYIPLDIKYDIADLIFMEQNSIVFKIQQILEILKKWAEKYSNFSRNRFERYRKGEDVILSETEEQLFLNTSEIEAIHRKRNAVLQRMIPPIKPKKRTLRKRKAHV